VVAACVVVACVALPLEDAAFLQLDAATAPVPAPAPAAEVTLPALTKEIGNRETEDKVLTSKISTEAQERQSDAVKAAAAAKDLKTAVATEVTQRNSAINTQIESVTDVKKSVSTVSKKLDSDKAALDASVAKLDTALSSEVKNREQAVKANTDAMTAFKSTQATALTELKTEVQKSAAKLTSDVLAKDKIMEAAVKANDAAIQKEATDRAAEVKTERATFAAVNNKLLALEAAVKKMSNGVTAPNPALSPAGATTVPSVQAAPVPASAPAPAPAPAPTPARL